jgi:hypothetical protein
MPVSAQKKSRVGVKIMSAKLFSQVPHQRRWDRSG